MIYSLHADINSQTDMWFRAMLYKSKVAAVRLHAVRTESITLRCSIVFHFTECRKSLSWRHNTLPNSNPESNGSSASDTQLWQTWKMLARIAHILTPAEGVGVRWGVSNVNWYRWLLHRDVLQLIHCSWGNITHKYGGKSMRRQNVQGAFIVLVSGPDCFSRV